MRSVIAFGLICLAAGCLRCLLASDSSAPDELNYLLGEPTGTTGVPSAGHT
jgi:hypothetical protein